MREMINSANIGRLRQLAQVRCGWIAQVRWSPSGSTLAVAAGETVRLFVNTFGGAPTFTLNGHSAPVKGIAFNHDGSILASVGADMRVILWDLGGALPGAAEVRQLAVLRGHEGAVEAAAFSPDGATLATGGGDRTVRTWEAATGQPKAVLCGHSAEVTSVMYALDGNVLISGSWDNTVRLWDAASETDGALLGEHDDWVREIAVNPTGTMVASVSKDSSVRLWDVYGDAAYAHIRGHWGGADCVGFSPDGKLLATGGRDDVVRLWDLDQVLRDRESDKLTAIAHLEEHSKPIISLAFNPSGTLLATASGDNTIRLWGV